MVKAPYLVSTSVARDRPVTDATRSRLKCGRRSALCARIYKANWGAIPFYGRCGSGLCPFRAASLLRFVGSVPIAPAFLSSWHCASYFPAKTGTPRRLSRARSSCWRRRPSRSAGMSRGVAAPMRALAGFFARPPWHWVFPVLGGQSSSRPCPDIALRASPDLLLATGLLSLAASTAR